MDTTTAYIENSRLLVLSDGILQTEDGQNFPINKNFLAKCKYFRTLFLDQGEGKKEYLIPGISGDTLGNILSYIYTEKIHVTGENICDIITASDQLLLHNLLGQMKPLFEKNISASNCLEKHPQLMRMARKDFLKVSYRFIQTHFEEIVCNVAINYWGLPFSLLKQLCSDRNLRVEEEKVIWQVIVCWIVADLRNRLCRVPDLLMCLRLTDVDENLASEIVTHAIVAKNTFCEAINSRSATNYRSILEYHQSSVCTGTQDFPFYIPRKPSRLNFIARNIPFLSSDVTELYVTYDEDIDLWRKMIDVEDFLAYLVCIGDCIYLFTYSEAKLRYSVTEREWVGFADFTIPRSTYTIVSLGGLIYAIGGHSSYNEITKRMKINYDVEIYDPEENSWHNTTPVFPTIVYPKAVTLNGLIYVVGGNAAENGMSAQMYNPFTEIWNELPGPSFYRNRFALGAYNKKIYIIGGYIRSLDSIDHVTNVEVFDPLKNVWNSAESLPFAYIYPKALVINDELIVSDDTQLDDSGQKYDPPVQWNKERGDWDIIPESSPFFRIHDYFFSVQEGEDITIISKENKKQTTVFEKSPFS